MRTAPVQQQSRPSGSAGANAQRRCASPLAACHAARSPRPDLRSCTLHRRAPSPSFVSPYKLLLKTARRAAARRAPPRAVPRAACAACQGGPNRYATDRDRPPHAAFTTAPLPHAALPDAATRSAAVCTRVGRLHVRAAVPRNGACLVPRRTRVAANHPIRARRVPQQQAPLDPPFQRDAGAAATAMAARCLRLLQGGRAGACGRRARGRGPTARATASTCAAREKEKLSRQKRKVPRGAFAAALFHRRALRHAA